MIPLRYVKDFDFLKKRYIDKNGYTFYLIKESTILNPSGVTIFCQLIVFSNYILARSFFLFAIRKA